MKYVKQLAVISLVAFLGEFLSGVLPLPVPGSVYGMLLMFLGLCLKVIRLEHVENVADFLLLIMPIFFVAPGVGIIETYASIKDSVWTLILISVVTTFLIMVVTGWVSQLMIRIKEKREKKREGGMEA